MQFDDSDDEEKEENVIGEIKGYFLNRFAFGILFSSLFTVTKVSYSGDDEGSSEEEEEGAEADWSETLKGGYDAPPH